jgi:2-acylglycerol O-acyltransferase 2
MAVEDMVENIPIQRRKPLSAGLKSKKIAGLDYEIVPAYRFENSNNVLDRILSTFGVILFIGTILLLLFGSQILCFYFFISYSWARLPLMIYASYMVFDARSAHTGWKNNWFRMYMRNHKVWDWFRAYFPAYLVKTHDVDPKRKYILGYHPHGVYAFALFSNIVFSHHFSRLFPSLDLLMTTLPANFWFPFWRDYALALGTGTCTSSSIEYRLKNGDVGSTIVIALGGAEEFKHLNNGTMDLILKKRKGFAKIALKTGTSLLPVLGFGENEIYSRLTHPAFDLVHKGFHMVFKSAAPLFIGKYATLFPLRHPLITVGMFSISFLTIVILVGKPIYVDKVIANPTEEQIQDLHQKYLDGLQQLYDDYKDIFHTYRKQEMRFVR